jgi:hypothetical protein
MDGSSPVFFKVGTRNKSPITQLTIERARIARKCHGRVFRERKKLEADKGKDAPKEEGEKETNEDRRTIRKQKRGNIQLCRKGAESFCSATFLSRRGFTVPRAKHRC